MSTKITMGSTNYYGVKLLWVVHMSPTQIMTMSSTYESNYHG